MDKSGFTGTAYGYIRFSSPGQTAPLTNSTGCAHDAGIIENPILNSPYSEPAQHWRFDANDQITNVIDPGRRASMVINDEVHHCYRSKPAATKEKMTKEEASEAKARAEEARLWITGLEAVHKKIGVKTVFDLSATPFYLKGSGYREGDLFPWVVSDFSLMDSIECGIVKIPRVPIADNAMTGDYPLRSRHVRRSM
jgi:hypothetical protein